MRPSELDYYADGAWYDAEYVHMRGDIRFYAEIAAQAPGPILELACGTGRLTIPMAQIGAEVVGVDFMASMIDEADAKKVQLMPAEQERLTFVVGDMRSLRLGRKFPTVVLGFNTLMHMTDDDDLQDTLRTVVEHLEPQGRFYIDLHTPNLTVVERPDPNGRYDPQEMIDPKTRDRYIVTENNTYDPREQIKTLRFFYQKVNHVGQPIGEEWQRSLRLRVIYPRELDRWLHLAGFEIVEDYDDFDRSQPFTGESGWRVLTARLRN